MNSLLFKSYVNVLTQQVMPKNCYNCFNTCIRFNTSDSNNNNNNYCFSDVFEKPFRDLSVDTFKPLITNNKIKSKIELILNEFQHKKYTTLRVPTTLSMDEMKGLLTIEDSLERKEMIDYFFRKETKKIENKVKRKENSDKYFKQLNEKSTERECNRTGIWRKDKQELVYGLWHNTLFSKISKQSVNRLHNNRLRNAALFGQKLVIDLGFDKYMKLYEKKLLLKQLSLLYNYNKCKTKEPFDLHFTDCNPKTTTMQEMSRYLSQYNTPQFMASVHNHSYLDLFPKQQLVYLSPHSNKPLHSFNSKDIYIIGGMIDISYREPITYIKAQNEGIRTARLPLDEHLIWRKGSKSLGLDLMIAILHDMKMSGDWKQVLKHNIPKWCQKSSEDIAREDQSRRERISRYRDSFNKKNRI